MTATFSLTITGIILGGIGLLLCLIFAIIKLAAGKNQQAGIWAVGFAVALVIVIVSVFGLVRAIKEKVTETAENWKNNFENYDQSQDDYQKNERQYWLDTLDLYTNEMYKSKMPQGYYKNEEIQPDSLTGKMMLPFLFPYSLNYDSYNYIGDIMANDSVFVYNVSEFAFDENFVIAKIDNKYSKELLKQGHAEIEYLLFDLRTGNYESAPNKEKLMDLANRIGYTGPSDMKYLSDAYRGWVGYYNEYD